MWPLRGCENQRGRDSLGQRWVVDANGRPVVGGDRLLMEPRQLFMEKNGVIVARALVDATSSGVPVQLISLGSREVTSRKGSRVGQLVTLDEVLLSVVDDKSATGRDCGRSGEDELGQESAEKFRKCFKWAGSSLTSTEREHLEAMLWNYRVVFSMGAGDVGRTDLITRPIRTGDAVPIKQPPRRVPHALRSQIDRQVQKVIQNRIVQPSTSPWSSPVLVRKKKVNFAFALSIGE